MRKSTKVDLEETESDADMVEFVPTAMETEHLITPTKPNKRKTYDYPTPSTEPGTAQCKSCLRHMPHFTYDDDFCTKECMNVYELAKHKKQKLNASSVSSVVAQ